MGIYTTLDAWTDVCRSLFPKPKGASVHPIHSCIINGKRHYIHSPSLAKKDPNYFQQLIAYARKHCIELQADRRTPSDRNTQGRRKKFLPIMFLALGVNAGSVFADEGNQRSLSMVANDRHMDVSRDTTQPHAELTEERWRDLINPALSKHLQAILQVHLVSQRDDPKSMQEDIKNLADYYSGHPEAVTLIEAIADKEWELMYAPHTFQTDVSGTRLHVDDITVYFDPRSGAKLKFYDKCADKTPFCVASPADALLHELLHVHSILNEPARFIADGGLDLHVYPAAHERKTILKENILYKSMSRRDKHPRPIRSEHSGRHVLVSCVTCEN